MGCFTYYAANKILDHVHRNASWTMPANLYACLFTANPGKAGSLTNEVTGGSYARVNVGSGKWGAAATGAITNSAGSIAFPTATANWGTVTYFGLADASSGGNLLWFAPLANAEVINTGGQLTLPTSSVTYTLD